jgi:hypothetical protein
MSARDAWTLVLFCSSAILVAAWMALDVRWPAGRAAPAPMDFSRLERSPPVEDAMAPQKSRTPLRKGRVVERLRPAARIRAGRPSGARPGAGTGPAPEVGYNAMATWRAGTGPGSATLYAWPAPRHDQTAMPSPYPGLEPDDAATQADPSRWRNRRDGGY